ncbi:tyrosine-type recombinase/integrase [Streptomyces sp. RPT161]|uniref:tyrosine-type recombinase/integrase n=1 Tax=Streptomyces sp. RPT161 TaxID=3015993 RepID=UPI0022B8BACD|nr:tyrosine-type recombinase/integrase [Streptomyces sp. RPT161]
MTTLPAPRPAPGELSTARHDPRDDWPDEARALRDDLADIYGVDDPLPDVAGAWIGRQKSSNTRKAYARRFRAWEAYARSAGVHPLQAKLPLADAYARHIETAPTLVRVKGARRGEIAPTGEPLKPSGQAQALSAAGSFYGYAARIGVVPSDPFAAVKRPEIDPDHSSTEGLTQDETARLLATARDWSPRSYALVALLYLLGPRVDEVLALDVDQLGYDRGHRTLPLRRKGGRVQAVPVPPLALDALMTYLEGRTDGPLFTTGTGRRWSEPEVWKHLRVLARQAGIPQADSIKPHALRHGFITDGLDAGVPLHEMQDAAGHRDPRTTQRYNRRRGRLDGHPTYTVAAAMAERLEHHQAQEERA